MGLLVVGVLAHRLITLGALVALSLVLALASRLGVRRLAVRAWIFVPLFTAVIALPAITNWVSPGRPLLTLWQGGDVSLGPLHLPGTLAIPEPGLLSAAHLVLRVTAVVSFAALLTLTTRWNDLLRSLRVVRAPKMFVFVLAVAYRYVHLLARLLRDTLLARKSRLVGPSGGKENRRFLGAGAAALFGKSQAMGEQVHSAMLARGYQGEVHTLETWRLRRLDLIWALGVATVCAVAIWLSLASGHGF
jgi:cobalt/nickel transport system permease protein